MQGVRAFQAHRLNFLCRIRQKDRQDHCISIYGSPVGMYLVGSRGMNPWNGKELIIFESNLLIVKLIVVWRSLLIDRDCV